METRIIKLEQTVKDLKLQILLIWASILLLYLTIFSTALACDTAINR